MADVFPPALVPVLHDRFGSRVGPLSDVADDVFVQLLTTVFFAGLETHEGERNAIQIVFLGKRPIDAIVTDAASSDGGPTYRWKLLRFESPRPFEISELVKLGVASAQGRMYAAVHLESDGKLVIAGLAREGYIADADPFIEVITPHPGCLSIRNGRERLEYERGTVLGGGEDVVFSAKRVRVALEAAARSAGLDEESVPDYLETVRAVVREMTTHGRGGILVIHCDDRPQVPESTAYRMVLDSSLASMMRLARHITRDDERPSRPSVRDLRITGRFEENVSFRNVLRNAFLSEADRMIEELGALTGIDGATILNRSLALVAFGVILPVSARASMIEMNDEGSSKRATDLGSRGTRHRASATYASEHSGCVVFVASEDGEVTCMFRESTEDHVHLWHLGPADIRAA